MITLEIKRILESDTVDSMKQAIMKLAEEIEELQENKNNIVQEEGLQNEVSRLSDKVDDKLDSDDFDNLKKRVEVLEEEE